MNTTEFQELLRNFYTQNGRDMPWRNSENGLFDPYKIRVIGNIVEVLASQSDYKDTN